MIIQIKRIISCSKSGTNANIRGYGTHNNTHTNTPQCGFVTENICCFLIWEGGWTRHRGEKGNGYKFVCVCAPFNGMFESNRCGYGRGVNLMRTYSERFSVYLLNGKFNPNLNKSMVRVRETNMTLDCCPTFRRKVTPDYVAIWMDIIIQTRKHTHTRNKLDP